MRKQIAAAAVTALILLAMTGSASAFTLKYDAGPDGFVLKYTSFPLLGSGTLTLADEDSQAQDLLFRFGILPFARLRLSILSMAPNVLSPNLTLHYELSVITLAGWKVMLSGDVTFLFGHGGGSNRSTYIGLHPDWELEGLVMVRRQTSSYVLDFGLPKLTGTWKAETNAYSPKIQQTVTRTNGDKFADIRLSFDPQLATNNINFLITVTPHQPATTEDTFVLSGSLPVPYGDYHFWFYRDPRE